MTEYARTRIAAAVAGAGWLLALAAQPAAQTPQPTCVNCPATYIDEREIQQYLDRAKAERIIDQQVRSVDVGKSNVAIGLVHRTRITTPGEVAEHDFVSEVYHVISGSATLVTGPDLVEPTARPATNTNVRPRLQRQISPQRRHASAQGWRRDCHPGGHRSLVHADR
jgi:hypothetical protein